MKKYLLTWIAGLIAVGVLGRAMFNGKLSTSTATLSAKDNIFALLPSNFDQLLYFSFDDELREAMQQIELSGDNQWFESLATSVDQLMVIQSTSEDNSLSLMFLVNDAPIDIKALQDAGVIVADPSYVTTQLGTNVWLYWDAVSVNAYEAEQKKWAILSEKWFGDWVTQMRSNQYNVGMFSYAQVTPTTPSLAAQLAQSLRWTTVASHLWKENAFGQVIMQFSGDVIPEPTEAFTPKFYSTSSSGAVAYFELTNILDLFGIDQEQFTALAPLLFSQKWWAAYSALLSNEDYIQLYDTLRDHIAISVEPTTGSLIGLGAQFTFADGGLFPVLKSLGPVRKSMIGWASGAVQVQERTIGNTVTYSSPEIPFSLFGQSIQLSHDDSTTTLAIGIPASSNSDQPSTDLLSYTDNTILAFIIDTKQLQNAMNMAQGVAGQVDQLGVGKYLQRGKIAWNLSADGENDQLELSFKVE